MKDQETNAVYFFVRGQKDFKKGNFQNCIKDLIYAQEIFSSIGNKRQSAETLLLLGTAYYNINQFSQARQFYSLAISRFQELNLLPKIGECALLLGVIYREEGEFKKSKQYLAKATDTFTNLSNLEKLGDSWKELALTYQTDLVEYSAYPARAVNAYKKAIEIYKKIKLLDKKAEVENDLGHLLVSQTKYEESLKVFQNALNHFKKQKDKDQIIALSILIGRVFFELDKKSKAKDYMFKAIDEMKNFQYSTEKINQLKQTILTMFN